MKAKEICSKAAKLVSGDRHEQHGDLHENFANIAAILTGYLHGKLKDGETISPAEAADIMECMKIARRKTGAVNPDDYTDGAGYAAVAGELATAQRK